MVVLGVGFCHGSSMGSWWWRWGVAVVGFSVGLLLWQWIFLWARFMVVVVVEGYHGGGPGGGGGGGGFMMLVVDWLLWLWRLMSLGVVHVFFFFFSLGGGVIVVDVGSWCQFLVEGWWVC